MERIVKSEKILDTNQKGKNRIDQKTDYILAWKCLSDRTTLMRNFEF